MHFPHGQQRFGTRCFPIMGEVRKAKGHEAEKVKKLRNASLVRLEGKEPAWSRFKRLLRAPKIKFRIWRQRGHEDEAESVMSGGEGERAEAEQTSLDDGDDEKEEEAWLGDYTEVLEEYVVE